MASRATEPPIGARVDREGRLLAADPPLLALQEAAGGRLGTALAVPQLAAIARLASRLGVTINRSAVAASEAEDLDLWVRAEPDRDGVSLTVERWAARTPAQSRWAGDSHSAAEGDEPADALLVDSELRIVSLEPGMVRRLAAGDDHQVGRPLIRLLRPVEDEEGNLPLLAALARRAPFHGQPAQIRGSDRLVLLDGTPRMEGDRFAGYSIRLRDPAAGAASGSVVPLDDLLREPLAAIISDAQQIAARSEGPLRSDYAGYGADIAAAAHHLLGVLATLSHQADGAPAGNGQLFDLAEVTLDAAALVQPQATARQVLLDIGGAPRVSARGQPRAIAQILVNLIANAVRYSPEGGAVTITLDTLSGEAAVTVSDAGPGVTPADRARIFERFEQAEPQNGGAGLGLAISRRLAREMGGEVELLDSPAGATFRLRLPAP